MALLVLMLGAQILLLCGAAIPTARAAPGDRPVEVVIASITPKVGAPGATIEVTGLLVNRTNVPITGLTIRLQRGPALHTRTDLADNDSEPVEVNDSSTQFSDLPSPLPGSGLVPFSYTTTADALGLSETGSYPLLINVNGQPGSEPPSRVGEQVILLPYFAEPPTTVTELSWMWPLVAPPELNSAGVVTGIELAQSVSPGGRLDRALSVIEAPPVTPEPVTPGSDGVPASPGAPTTSRPVTLAVDPALLQTVGILAEGNYPLLIDGQLQTSTFGSLEAANWLNRLRVLAVSHPIISLAYGDPDIATLVSQGQTAAVERLLPDGRSGDLVEEILGVSPDLSVAWPPQGAIVVPAVLDTLAEHGVSQVITRDLLTLEPAPDARTLDPRSTIPSQSGEVTALVADQALSELIGRDISEAGSRAMIEERFLAELVAVASEDPAQGRHLLIVPDRQFDPATAAALMQVTDGQSWLGTELPTDLDITVPDLAPRTMRPPVRPASAIPPAQLATLITAMRERDDFASALSNPQTALLNLDRALGRAATVNRTPETGAASVLDAAAAVSALRGTVGIVVPTNGTYSLASADAPLVLTVRNDNPFPVEVAVALSPRGAPGVQTTNLVQELPAQAVTTLTVPANVERSGSFTMIATVSTPTGSSLGVPVQLRVQSTVYGPVALTITFGAGALLVLLFARRSVKYWRRRSAQRDGTGRPPDVGQTGDRAPNGVPVLVDPPRRSPV